MLDADPNVISSIMGLFKPSFVRELKERRIKWFATVTSVSEAIIAEEAGADALVVQGSEAGGHRGNFCTDYAQSAGLMALLPTVSDAVAIPIIATADRWCIRSNHVGSFCSPNWNRAAQDSGG